MNLPCEPWLLHCIVGNRALHLTSPCCLSRMCLCYKLFLWNMLLGLANAWDLEVLLAMFFLKQEHARNACSKLHPCGHMCGGIKGEAVCLPCLHGCSSNPTLKQDADDMCMICFTEALSCAPAIQVRLWNDTKEVWICEFPIITYVYVDAMIYLLYSVLHVWLLPV